MTMFNALYYLPAVKEHLRAMTEAGLGQLPGLKFIRDFHDRDYPTGVSALRAGITKQIMADLECVPCVWHVGRHLHDVQRASLAFRCAFCRLNSHIQHIFMNS